MKITFEFDEKNEEQAGFEGKIARMMKVDKAYGALYEIKGKIRTVWKYDAPMEGVFEEIQDIINGIDFDGDGYT